LLGKKKNTSSAKGEKIDNPKDQENSARNGKQGLKKGKGMPGSTKKKKKKKKNEKKNKAKKNGKKKGKSRPPRKAAGRCIPGRPGKNKTGQ